MQNRFQFALVGLLVAGLVSCGDDDDDPATPTPQGVQGEAGLCADLALVEGSLEQVMNLDSSATLQDAEDARDTLNLAITELGEAESTSMTAQIAALQGAFETFNAALDSQASGTASGGQALGDGVDTLKASANEISQAQEQMKQSSECPP